MNNDNFYSVINDLTFTLILFLMTLIGMNNIHHIENKEYKEDNKKEKTVILFLKNNKIITEKREYKLDEFENNALSLNDDKKLNIILKVYTLESYQSFFNVISILNKYGIEKICIQKVENEK